MSFKVHQVLIAIPDKPSLDVIAKVISNLGHKPIMVTGEEEAVSAFANKQEIATVIVDWELSQRYFPDILKRIEGVSPYVGKFVMIDSHDMKIKKHIENGDFCGYAKKPFDLEQFESGVLGCIKEYERKKSNCACVTLL